MSSTTRTATARTAERTGSRMVVKNRTRNRILQLLIVILGSLFAVYPFAVIVGTSFSETSSISSGRVIPEQISFVHYETLFANTNITPVGIWLRNSIFVSSVSTVVTLLLTTLAAYSFSRFRYYGRQTTLMATLIIQVFPSVAALVAFYLLLQQIGRPPEEGGFMPQPGGNPLIGLNSLGGVILIYTGGALGANAWLMKGYFDTIPREIDESAQVDGATHWITFWQIILPLIRPILAVVGLLSFIGTFNDFLIPRTLLRENSTYTLAVGLTTFLGVEYGLNWGIFAAGALIGTLPIVIVFLVLQTQIVGGLSQGAVKG
jgi:arabinogalactan oligomer / maltooligosaccharide transport system permease protein